MMELPSSCLALQVEGLSPNEIESVMRAGSPPIIARIEDDRYVIDLRTIQEDEYEIIEKAFRDLLKRTGS